MTRLLPYPVGSAAVFVLWLVIANTLVPAHVAAAAVLAVAIPWLVRAFLGAPVRPRAPWAAARLALVVFRDIVVSNIVVARLVLGPTGRLRPAFFEVPFDLEHPYAISLLASIITMTPGTVSAEVDEARRVIAVHALDIDDKAAAVRDIKARYEAPLKEILG